ncbi:hypothetical protein K437DRAFT_256652 [Tilletiaria anomala UBC 951]|uniref:PWI domain-containing protein n=1 Tax=Tilletiaria anomala (strain ATCC 24038 / CBS 436.72 / UBC 951) TaxID=1037660 RepID=A0A066VYF3_TILAU|nr:uncharacterized protein K437DRAFT_256652 [Tilletiaria anomala UBC 951]KDN45308.1 hypothetical protein K437DRAFT_256652 [Tilletiaria anomala UBC 951]
MADGGYRGISLEQDSVRFSNKDKVLLKKLEHTFPRIYSTTELLGFEDDVVTEYAMSLLEDPNNQNPDPRKLQISLTGFLEAKAPQFMTDLWTLLISAQTSVGGIPKEFVEAKKKELQNQREKDERLMREVAQRGGGPVAGGSGGYDRNRGGGRGPPLRVDKGRNGSGGRGDDVGHGRNTFRDKNGNVTERSRDSGWDARVRPQSPPYDDYDRSQRQPPGGGSYFDEQSAGRNDYRREYGRDDYRGRGGHGYNAYRCRDPRDRSPYSPPPPSHYRQERSYSRSPVPPPWKRPRDSRDVTPPHRIQSAPRGRSPSRSLTPPIARRRQRSSSASSYCRSSSRGYSPPPRSPPRRAQDRDNTPPLARAGAEAARRTWSRSVTPVMKRRAAQHDCGAPAAGSRLEVSDKPKDVAKVGDEEMRQREGGLKGRLSKSRYSG